MSAPTLAWFAQVFPGAQARAVADAYARVFGPEQASPAARLILEDLARYCGLRVSGFVAGAPDQTAFNEGQRDVLLHLLSAAGADPGRPDPRACRRGRGRGVRVCRSLFHP